MNLSYDLDVLGFGSQKGSLSGEPNAQTGFLANPYRTVNLGGSPTREQVPFQRVRQAATAGLFVMFPTGARLVPYLVFKPSYRFYWDDWGLFAHTIELRTHLPIGPIELRFTGRYYTQSAATFWNEVDGRPTYADNQGKPCNTCLSSSARGRGFYTSDPKLAAADDFFFEVRLLLKLRALRREVGRGLGAWLSDGLIELSYGHLFNDRYFHLAYGDAEVAGLSFTFPL
jgi:hypothetical protein